DEYDLVIVVHPREFNERAIWALDEWVTRGGNTLIFLDPYSLDDQPPQNPQQPWAAYQYKPSSNLGPLLAAWGLERKEDQVVGDFELGLKRTVARRGPAERVIVDLQIDDQTREQTLNTGHPVFQGLSNLRFFLAGSLEETATGDGDGGDTGADGVTRTPLITTTSNGNTLEVKPGFPDSGSLVFLDLQQPGKIADQFIPGTEPVALAYLVQGELPPVYPSGASIPGPTPPPPPGLPPGVNLPPQQSDEIVQKDAVPEDQRGAATVMVFADVDFISDQVAFQNSPFGAIAVNDNHKVLLNAVDFLFGSEELMQVRSKASIERPFTLFDEIEAQADRETLEREKELRAEIASFEEQLRDKQSGLGAQNAALFQKQVQDEVDQLNDRIREANRELADIRKEKRAALESEEARVRFATLGSTPLLVLALGLFLFFRRRSRDARARRSVS
ncbi:MAG: Gldg family protein, partial [Acidobacteriota bacterium]